MNGELFQNGGAAADRSEAATRHSPDGSTERIVAPLADRMRPRRLEEVVGQGELLGPTGPLRRLLAAEELPSLILWGPPGSGKTTLARLLAHYSDMRFLEFSAVAVGVREVRAVLTEAEKLRRSAGRGTILFLDEIHRFNKAQQDALLPWVERGDVTLIGATTENPSFEVNAALLSRMRLFVLAPLTTAQVQSILERALRDERGLQGKAPRLTPAALTALAEISEGDARCALNLLESIAAVAPGPDEPSAAEIDADDLPELIQRRAARYDKNGEEHYNLISALHKSMRNSDAQASLYWLTRMLEGGEDPLYMARRLVRFASEDVGLADPAALTQALAARDAVHFIGLPEGALALAQATLYLALAPKSNALYRAFAATREEVRSGRNPPVPYHLRNAPTDLMRGIGYGRGYVYAHDRRDGLTEMECLPAELGGRTFYQPTRRGFEAQLADRMAKIVAWRQRRAERDRERTGGNP